MKGAAEVSCYYPCYLGFPLPPSASPENGFSPGAPEASFPWRRSLPFIGLTLPWGHLAEGSQVRESYNPRNLAVLLYFLPEGLIFPDANQALQCTAA